MAETRNIVVLGASFSGLAAAHYIAKHILPKLKSAKDVKYELHLVDPSTHFWWHIAAPRAIVSVKEMKHSDYFVPIKDGFKQYPDLKDSIIFHQAEATTLNTNAHSITLMDKDMGVKSLDYYALVIATGVKSPTPLTTLHGEHTVSQKALEDMNTKLASAKDIVVGGGGPIGVETCGELGSHLGGKAKITLIAGGDKLLPILKKSRSDKAQKQLEKLGVVVKYKVKVQSTSETEDGKVNVELDNGETMTADAYIPAVGIKPNTSFLPEKLKRANGFVQTNKNTLRVDDAGPRVYCVGDVAGVDHGSVLNLFSSIPVFGANMAHDLFADAKVGSVAEKRYTAKEGGTQLVPIGPKGGVAAWNDTPMPGFFVAKFKGKDYMKGQIPGITEGKKFTKA